MTQSRRVSPRIPYDEAVCIVRTDERGRLYGRSLDLGVGGFSLLAEEACPVGVEIRCDLLLPHGPRPAIGRIVRVTPVPGGFELAIAFSDLKPATAAAISQLVAERGPPASPEELPLAGVDTPPPANDGLPRLALVASHGEQPRTETRRYGAVRTPAATTLPAARPLPTQLPPPCASALPSIVVSPALMSAPPVAEPSVPELPVAEPPPRRLRRDAGPAPQRPSRGAAIRRPPTARTAVLPAAKHAASPASLIPTARLTALEAPVWWTRASWLALGLSAAVVLAAAIEHLGR